MRILPVLDLMHGQIVRGVAGKRESYRPIESSLAAGSAPTTIALALAETFRADEMYLADLDAIRGGEPAWSTYAELLDSGISIWVDAGISVPPRARQLVEFQPERFIPDFVSGQARISGVIAGLESLRDIVSLAMILDVVGPERLIFSLDLQLGQPLARFDAWRHLTPLEIAREALAIGIERMIVLDLAGVGVGAGVPTLELCQTIRDEAPDLELTSGGGVRHLGDLHDLASAGCSAALVASALHDGRISPADVRTLIRRERT